MTDDPATERTRLLNMLRHYPAQPLIPEHLRPNKLMAEAADLIEQLEKNTDRIANMVLTAATPLIRDAALEEAAQNFERYETEIGSGVAAAIRAWKEQL